MVVLTIRTESKISEIGIYDGEDQLGYEKWQAHRDLSKTILTKIEKLLKTARIKPSDIEGIVFYKGPGSFTGLRIGAAVANTLAMFLPAKIISENDSDWIGRGVARLLKGEDKKIAQLEYGGEANVTRPKK